MSEIIKINWTGLPAAKPTMLMRVPPVLVCSVSARIRDLCASNVRRCFTYHQLVGMPTAEKIFLVQHEVKILDEFTRWIYTGIVSVQKCWPLSLWVFGQRIGAPGFQNAVVKALSKEKGFLKKASRANCLWKGIDFWRNVELEKGIGFDWSNKQMLKFRIDNLAIRAWDDEEIIAIFRTAGGITLHLAKAMSDARAVSAPQTPPWHSTRISEYLVDEDIFKIPVVRIDLGKEEKAQPMPGLQTQGVHLFKKEHSATNS